MAIYTLGSNFEPFFHVGPLPMYSRPRPRPHGTLFSPKIWPKNTVTALGNVGHISRVVNDVPRGQVTASISPQFFGPNDEKQFFFCNFRLLSSSYLDTVAEIQIMSTLMIEDQWGTYETILGDSEINTTYEVQDACNGSYPLVTNWLAAGDRAGGGSIPEDFRDWKARLDIIVSLKDPVTIPGNPGIALYSSTDLSRLYVAEMSEGEDYRGNNRNSICSWEYLYLEKSKRDSMTPTSLDIPYFLEDETGIFIILYEYNGPWTPPDELTEMLPGGELEVKTPDIDDPGL